VQCSPTANDTIPRSLKKEGKVYFWDFGEVPQRAARFENLVANQLLKACHYWTDSGCGHFDLHFLRNKEKEEIDFLVTRDGSPWLPVELKLTDSQPSRNWSKFLRLLRCPRGIQVTLESHWRTHRLADKDVLVTGAAEFLGYLP